MPVLVRSVAASAADVKYAFGVVWDLVGTELLVGNFGGAGSMPLIFNNVTIPRLSTINTVTLTAWWNHTQANNLTYTIRCQAIDTAPLFTTEPEFNGRAWTVFFNNGNFNGASVAAAPYVFPENINLPVREVTDRAGWVSGNSLCVCVFDNGSVTGGRFRAWDHGTGPPPQIEIDYDPPAGGVPVSRRRYHNFK